MPLKDDVSKGASDIRERSPLIDHIVRTVKHFSSINGSNQAGAVTYFAFLSFFPILALAFALIGFVAKVWPDAQENLVAAIDGVLPGMVGDGAGQISLSSIQAAAPSIFSIGLLLVLYSGLGWLSTMRGALQVVFETPQPARPNFVLGKLRDLVAMVTLGAILVLSVAVSGVITSLSARILGWLGLSADLSWLLWLVALIVGLAANALLFFAFFKLLGATDTPARSLWQGALLGAVGFEALKQLSRLLLASTTNQPAFQAFGIALILLVWINYFSKVIMYAAAWAYTTRAARARRDLLTAEQDWEKTEKFEAAVAAVAVLEKPSRTPAFVAGVVTTVGLLGLMKKKGKA